MRSREISLNWKWVNGAKTQVEAWGGFKDTRRRSILVNAGLEKDVDTPYWTVIVVDERYGQGRTVANLEVDDFGVGALQRLVRRYVELYLNSDMCRRRIDPNPPKVYQPNWPGFGAVFERTDTEKKLDK